MTRLYDYDLWEYVNPQWPGTGPISDWDTLDFHVDLGCGTVKKGRIGVDRYAAPGVDVVVDLESGSLPFETSQIESIISHHCLEHIGEGFIPLIDEVYRVLKPGGVFRAITPLFPSRAAVEDPDHCRYFMEGTWDSFCGEPGDAPNQCWLGSFSVPYTKARFRMVDKQCTPPVSPERAWGPDDVREIRVALQAVK